MSSDRSAGSAEVDAAGRSIYGEWDAFLKTALKEYYDRGWTTRRGNFIGLLIAAGGGTPVADREVNAIVHAAMEFQKVQVIMRRGDWTEALKVIREVKALHDGDADYHATEAWILFNRHKGSSAPFDKMLAAVDKALD